MSPVMYLIITKRNIAYYEGAKKLHKIQILERGMPMEHVRGIAYGSRELFYARKVIKRVFKLETSKWKFSL